MSAVIRCPECNAALRPKQVGARIRCPKCEHIFKPEVDEEDEAPRRVKVTTSPKRPVPKPELDEEEEESRPRRSARRNNLPEDEDEEDDRPAKKKKKRKKQGSSTMLIWILVGSLVGLLLLGGGGVGIYFLVANKDGKSASSSGLLSGSGSPSGGSANNPKITMQTGNKLTGRTWTKAEIQEMLGPPTKVLGPQELMAGFRSSETWEYRNGDMVLYLHWRGDQWSGFAYKLK